MVNQSRGPGALFYPAGGRASARARAWEEAHRNHAGNSGSDVTKCRHCNPHKHKVIICMNNEINCYIYLYIQVKVLHQASGHRSTCGSSCLAIALRPTSVE